MVAALHSVGASDADLGVVPSHANIGEVSCHVTASVGPSFLVCVEALRVAGASIDPTVRLSGPMVSWFEAGAMFRFQLFFPRLRVVALSLDVLSLPVSDRFVWTSQALADGTDPSEAALVATTLLCDRLGLPTMDSVHTSGMIFVEDHLALASELLDAGRRTLV